MTHPSAQCRTLHKTALHLSTALPLQPSHPLVVLWYLQPSPMYTVYKFLALFSACRTCTVYNLLHSIGCYRVQYSCFVELSAVQGAVQCTVQSPSLQWFRWVQYMTSSTPIMYFLVTSPACTCTLPVAISSVSWMHHSSAVHKCITLPAALPIL